MPPLPDRNMSSTPPLPPHACLIACLPEFRQKTERREVSLRRLEHPELRQSRQQARASPVLFLGKKNGTVSERHAFLCPCPPLKREIRQLNPSSLWDSPRPGNGHSPQAPAIEPPPKRHGRELPLPAAPPCDVVTADVPNTGPLPSCEGAKIFNRTFPWTTSKPWFSPSRQSLLGYRIPAHDAFFSRRTLEKQTLPAL